MTKRTNGEGTIYQDKKGLWRGELTLGYENGKRIKKQFSSMDLEVLQKKMNDEKFKLNRNMVTQNSNFTVKEWLEFWLKTYKLNSVKARTYDYYEFGLINYVYESIGKVKLDKLKTIQIQQLYNNLHERKLSTSTIKGVHIALNQAFEQAINNELIYKNPCKGLKIPKTTPRISRPLTIDEQEKFVNACTDTTYHNLFIFLLNTGMRCGEGMAITWQDIDFDNMTITVNKNISLIVNRDENAKTKNKQVIDTTKTESGTRIIPINKRCLSVLRKQENNKHSKSKIFVFSSRNATPLSQRNIGRAYSDLLKTLGLKEIDKKGELTIHSLRHPYVKHRQTIFSNRRTAITLPQSFCNMC